MSAMLLWKEWAQQKRTLLVGAVGGLLLFPGLSMLIAWCVGRHPATMAGTFAVLFLGVPFAVLLALSAAAIDVQGNMEFFWRSRPIEPARLFVAKFFVCAAGLMVVFLLLQIPTILTYWTATNINVWSTWRVLLLIYPLSIAAAGTATLLMVLTRDMAKALLLTVWIGGVVFVLPFVVRGLGWMSLPELLMSTNNYRPLPQVLHAGGFPAVLSLLWRTAVHDVIRCAPFLLLMLGAALGCLVGSVVAIERGWRWAPAQKTIAWLLGLSGLLAFASVAFQVGMDLKPATTFAGKPITSVVRLDSGATKALDWAGLAPEMITAPDYWDADCQSCVAGDYLFMIGPAFGRGTRWSGKPQTQDWMLNVYKHPAVSWAPRQVARARFFSSSTNIAESTENQPPGACVYVKDKRLYALYQPCMSSNVSQGARDLSIHLLVVDVNTPSLPTLVTNGIVVGLDEKVAGRRGRMAYCDDTVYIAFPEELLVVSMAEPENPRLVRTVGAAELGVDRRLGIPRFVSTPAPGVLICADTSRVMLVDITDPHMPRRQCLIEHAMEENDLAARIRTVAYAKDRVYVGTGYGLTVYAVEQDGPGKTVGRLTGGRRVTPLEGLAERRPMQLLVCNDVLIEAAGGFGLLVYDLSDPDHPKRIRHGGEQRFVGRVWIWNGLLCAGSFGNMRWNTCVSFSFFDLPYAVGKRQVHGEYPVGTHEMTERNTRNLSNE